MAYHIELERQPRRDLAVVNFRASAADMGQKIGQAFGAVHAYLVRTGVQVGGPAVALYKSGPPVFDVSAGFVVPSAIPGDGNVVPGELPDCDAAVTTHVGGYESLPAAYPEIHAWMQANGREPADFMWEEYYSGPSTPPDQTRTGIIWPVKPPPA